MKIDLTNTKQGNQITELKSRLEKSGWRIIEEIERKFKGKPRWELNDETPNLIYSWSIQRDSQYGPFWLDFIAYWDYITYETFVSDCSHCEMREREIVLHFVKDKGLRVERELLDWKDRLDKFMKDLNEIENNV